MAKNWNLQDIRPPDRKKSPQGDPKGAAHPNTDMRRPERDNGANRPSGQPARNKKSGTVWKRPFLLKVGGVLVAVVVLTLLIGIFRTGADITIHPKFRETTVDGSFTAHREPAVGELGYELLTLEADGERQVAASGQEETEERAEGTVVIYNEFTENPLRLVKNTRLQSPDGLIFKITESAVVPGFTRGADNAIIPGSVTADVFADATGEEYNIGPAHFTVPGFAGEPEFEDVYAESTEPFTGGFKGLRYIVDENELTNVEESLHEELRAALLSRLSVERPAGFILYQDAVIFSFESLPAMAGSDNMAIVKVRGRLHVPLFDAAQFASYIAQYTVSDYNGEAVRLEDPQTLQFAYADTSVTDAGILGQGSLNFELTGRVNIIWDYDEESLREALAGLSRNSLENVLSEYPAIEQANATVRPVWRGSFPEDVTKIRLHEVVDNGEQE